jgi:CRISPR-associated RAMP protein (TIGR02581 family)
VGEKNEWCVQEAGDLDDEGIVRESCLVSRVFGSPWLASKVSIRDLLVDEQIWFGQFEVRNGVAIDRDTETAAEKKLYDFEVVPSGTRFHCEIVVENAIDWELGLLMAGLRPFERGEATLGGARSRGLGLVKVEWKCCRLIDAKRLGKEKLLDYLIGEEEAPDISDEDLSQWRRAFLTELKKLGGESHA